MKCLEESVEKKLKSKDSKQSNKSTWLAKPFIKKTCTALALLGWLFFLGTYFYTSTHIYRPTDKEKVVAYFEETGADLKYLYCSLLQGAKKSIYYSSFGLSDRDILRILQEKKAAGVSVTFHNSKKEKSLRKKTSGLYHRKFLVIDDAEIYLGSANCTLPSLTFHGNQILGFSNKHLIQAVQNGESFVSKELSLYLLPGNKKAALHHLLEKIRSAKEQIDVAMYALTHKEIITALIAAHDRGVKLSIYLDGGMARGTCKRFLTSLQERGISLRVREKGGLLHHKCARIDHCFVFGSTNWTASGFSKNEETLLFVEHPTKAMEKQIEHFFQRLHFFSKETLNIDK